MRKSAAVSVFAAMLLAGCVSVAPSTTGPSASPTLGVTTPAPIVTATPAPSATPTAAIATATPTLAPTPTQAATPTPTTPVPSEEPTATPEPTETPPSETSPDLVFEDDFTDPTSGWGTVEESFGSASYEPGAFVLSPTLTGAWLFSSRDLGTTESVVRAVGEFSPSSDGSFGMLCGDVAGEDLYGALVGTSGAWAFVHVVNSTVEVLSSDQEAGLNVPLASKTLLAVQCFGTVTGGFRMILYMSGTGPIATYESADGPAAFDRVALYGEAASDDFEANVFHAAAFAVGGPVGTMSTAATDLVGHVPSDWQDTCFQTPLPPFLGQNATALITCFIADVSAGSDILEYVQFDSKGDQDAAYQLRVANFPVANATSDCSTGQGEHAYHFTGDPSTTVGRLLCAPQTVGIRIDWTDDRLNILSSLVDFDGSYGDAFDDWNNGGPNT